MNLAAEMAAALVEIRAAIVAARWGEVMSHVAMPNGERPHDLRAFETNSHGYHIVVVSFSIEDQGFPPGSRGWDGVARKGTTFVHLTRELAQTAVELAENAQAHAEVP